VRCSFPIDVRISGATCYEGGYGIEEGVKIAMQLDGKVDLIHVSAGSHEVPEVFTVTHPACSCRTARTCISRRRSRSTLRTPSAPWVR